MDAGRAGRLHDSDGVCGSVGAGPQARVGLVRSHGAYQRGMRLLKMRKPCVKGLKRLRKKVEEIGDRSSAGAKALTRFVGGAARLKRMRKRSNGEKNGTRNIAGAKAL